MKTSTLIFLLLAIFFINSCRNIECPCFDKSQLTWMPYEVGDRLIYVNQQNDSLIFTVKSKHLSETYKEKKRFEDDCISNAVFHLSDTERSQYYFNIDNNEAGTSITCKISLQISDNVFSSGIASSYIEGKLDTMTINGKFYNEVLVIERDTVTYSENIWKIIIANNYGIIRFFDRKTGYVWTLSVES